MSPQHFTLIYALSAAVSFSILLVAAARDGLSTPVSRSFSIIALSTSLWNLGYVYISIADTKATVHHLYTLISPTWIVMTVAICFFVYELYRQHFNWRFRKWPYILFLIPLPYFLYGAFSGQFLANDFYQSQGFWIEKVPLNHFVVSYGIILIAFYLAYMNLLILMLSQRTSKRLRYQALIVVIPSILVLTVSIPQNFIFPMLGIQTTPPLAQIFVTFVITFIGISFSWFPVLSISPHSAIDQVIDLVSDASILVDPRGTVRFASKSLFAVTGHYPADVNGKTVDTFLPDDISGCLLIDAETCPSQLETVIRHKEGRDIHCSCIIRKVNDRFDDHLGSLLIIREISELVRLKRISERDYLTGILNRRMLESVLEDVLLRFRRYQHPLSVILFDIDHFKLINDRFGHQTGDDVLIAISQIASSLIRTTDFFGRWGGEEFIVITTNTSASQAQILAERMRTTIMDNDFGVAQAITASFGITEIHESDTAEAIVARADAAMYQSKEKGRNRVTVES